MSQAPILCVCVYMRLYVACIIKVVNHSWGIHAAVVLLCCCCDPQMDGIIFTDEASEPLVCSRRGSSDWALLPAACRTS